MSYSIQLATLSSLDDLWRMALAHHRASEYTVEPDQGYGMRFLKDCILDEDRLVLLLNATEDVTCGVLIGVAQFHPFLPITIGSEILWWVDPEHRGHSSLKLLEAFEYWAKEVKHCDVLSCADVVSHSIGAIYLRRGYKLEEQTWTKEL